MYQAVICKSNDEVLKCIRGGQVFGIDSSITELDLQGMLKIFHHFEFCHFYWFYCIHVWTGNTIGAKGAEVLGEALKYNNSVTTLNLKGMIYWILWYKWSNLWTGNRIGNRGAKILENILKCNNTLTTLNLEGIYQTFDSFRKIN